MALDKSTSDITDLDIFGLTEFAAPGQGISDIAGLEYTMHLTTFNVWVNQLTDNQISDISPMMGLIGLSRLYLSDNMIADVSPVANLTDLPVLHLDDNEIDDVMPVSDLKNLEDLDCVSRNACGLFIRGFGCLGISQT